MKQILVAYLISILANRAFNWLWWWGRNPRAGPLGYFREHGPTLAATLILHVFVFPAWAAGLLLPLVNKILGVTLGGADLLGAEVAIPSLEAVTPAITLSCGWIIDSVTSRVGMLVGSKFALFTNGRSNGGKETP